MKFETGEKIGKLTIICLAKSHTEILLICSCECYQIVKLSEAELKRRQACLKCQAKAELKRFAPGDIAVFRVQFGEIPFGAQVIVNGSTESLLEIEYRGRAFHCRPDEIESLGVNFYDKQKKSQRMVKR